MKEMKCRPVIVSRQRPARIIRKKGPVPVKMS